MSNYNLRNNRNHVAEDRLSISDTETIASSIESSASSDTLSVDSISDQELEDLEELEEHPMLYMGFFHSGNILSSASESIDSPWASLDPSEEDFEDNTDMDSNGDRLENLSNSSSENGETTESSQQSQIDEHVAVPATPPKKRKRTEDDADVAGTPVLTKANNDVEDDGMTCPICLDQWEVSGPHRLVSLRCGHLFGEDCIRRWLKESTRISNAKLCPQCKAKSHTKDIRQLYGRRIRAIDRSEEHKLREELIIMKRSCEEDRLQIMTLQATNANLKKELQGLRTQNATLRLGRDCPRMPINSLNDSSYRFAFNNNITLSNTPGCRVLLYSPQNSKLIASQQSAQPLFPGYGVRFIDVKTYATVSFLHMASKTIRDITISSDGQELAAASQEPICKLFDLRSYQAATQFSTGNSTVWACARGVNSNLMYLGTHNGAVKTYDVRDSQQLLLEFALGNSAPVISIAIVPSSETFPFGGFLVAKLTEVIFYEYTGPSSETTVTPLHVDGPFLSMRYEPKTQLVLISTRCTERRKLSQFICGKLVKVENVVTLETLATLLGSSQTKVMTRAAQLPLADTTIVLGYLQDKQQLVSFDLGSKERIQTLPMPNIVYDICGLKDKEQDYAAALTDTKCRIFKINRTGFP